MTPADIFRRLTALVAGLAIASFTAVLVANAVEPGSILARYCAALFQWSTWALIGYTIGVGALLLVWGAWQAIVGHNLIYLDNRQQVVIRRNLNQVDDFATLEATLPDPRRSNLAWLDDVIDSVLDKE